MASEAFVRVLADTSGVDRQLTEGMNRAIRDVEDRLPDIEVDAEIDPDAIRDMARTMQRSIRDIQRAAGDIEVDVYLDPGAIATARTQVAQLQSQLEDVDLSIHPEIEPAALARSRAQLAQLDQQLRDLEADDVDITVDVDVDRDELRGAADDTDELDLSFLRVIGTVGRLGTLIPVAIAGGTTAIVGLTGAVQSAVAAFGGMDSIVNQVAGAGAIYAASNAVLKLSLIGVSDALTAAFGSAEDFKEAMEGLSPQAQRVLTTFRSTVPVLEKFQQSLQDALFKQIRSGTVEKLADSVKSIQPAAEGVSTAFGKVGERLLELVTRKSVLADITTILEAAAPIIEKVGNFLADKLAVGLDRAAKGTGELGGTFDTLKLIFDGVRTVASDIGRIFGAIGDAATRAGLSLSGPLSMGLDAVADAFESPAGAEFLDTMVQLAQVLGGALSEALGTALSILLPFLQQVGSYLAMVAGPLGELVNLILPVLNPLFDAFGKILQAAAPFVTEVGNAVLLILGPALAALPGFLDKILGPLVRLAEEVFPIFTQAIQDNKPLLDQLGRDLGTLLEKAGPIVAKIIEFAIIALPYLADAAVAVLPYIIMLVDALIKFDTWVLNTLGDIKDWATGLLVSVTTAGVNFTSGVTKFTAKAATSISGFVNRSRTSITTWTANLATGASTALSRFNTAISNGTVKAARYFSQLPGKIRSAMGNAGTILYRIGASILTGLINGINSKVASLARTLSNITSKIPDWKGPMDVDKKLLTPAGQEVLAGFMRGISSQVPALRNQLQSLTAALPTMAVNNTVTSPASAMAQGVSTVNVSANPVIQNQVYIDGQQVRTIADQQIVRNNQVRDRLAAQGTRR